MIDELFCKIKHIARRCNEDSVTSCPVTSQVLKVHLHLSFVKQLNKITEGLIKSVVLKMEKGDLLSL